MREGGLRLRPAPPRRHPHLLLALSRPPPSLPPQQDPKGALDKASLPYESKNAWCGGKHHLHLEVARAQRAFSATDVAPTNEADRVGARRARRAALPVLRAAGRGGSDGGGRVGGRCGAMGSRSRRGNGSDRGPEGAGRWIGRVVGWGRDASLVLASMRPRRVGARAGASGTEPGGRRGPLRGMGACARGAGSSRGSTADWRGGPGRRPPHRNQERRGTGADARVGGCVARGGGDGGDGSSGGADGTRGGADGARGSGDTTLAGSLYFYVVCAHDARSAEGVNAERDEEDSGSQAEMGGLSNGGDGGSPSSGGGSGGSDTCLTGGARSPEDPGSSTWGTHRPVATAAGVGAAAACAARTAALALPSRPVPWPAPGVLTDPPLHAPWGDGMRVRYSPVAALLGSNAAPLQPDGAVRDRRPRVPEPAWGMAGPGGETRAYPSLKDPAAVALAIGRTKAKPQGSQEMEQRDQRMVVGAERSGVARGRRTHRAAEANLGLGEREWTERKRPELEMRLEQKQRGAEVERRGRDRHDAAARWESGGGETQAPERVWMPPVPDISRFARGEATSEERESVSGGGGGEGGAGGGGEAEGGATEAEASSEAEDSEASSSEALASASSIRNCGDETTATATASFRGGGATMG